MIPSSLSTSIQRAILAHLIAKLKDHPAHLLSQEQTSKQPRILTHCKVQVMGRPLGSTVVKVFRRRGQRWKSWCISWLAKCKQKTAVRAFVTSTIRSSFRIQTRKLPEWLGVLLMGDDACPTSKPTERTVWEQVSRIVQCYQSCRSWVCSWASCSVVKWRTWIPTSEKNSKIPRKIKARITSIIID